MSEPRDVTALEQQAIGLTQSIEALQVIDAETFAEAGELVKTVATYIKRVGEVLDPIVSAANHAHKVAVAQRDALLKPAARAKALLGERMATWEQAETQRRRDAEAAAQRERERLEREAAALAAAEQRRLQTEAEDRRLQEAAQLEAAGDRAGAERLIAAPVAAPLVSPAPVFAPRPPVAAPPKVEGVSFRDAYHAEVVDLMALVKAVAAGQAPLTLLQVNTTALNGLARSLKGALVIPGVKVVSDRVAAVRAG